MTARLLDVTLRDGGYVNEHRFSTAAAQRIVSALAAGGVPYIEVGYFRPGLWHADAPGPRRSDPGYLEAVAAVRGAAELVVMAHAEEVAPGDFARLPELGIARVRFTASPGGLLGLDHHVRAARGSGLAVSVNLIRASEQPLEAILAAARAAERMGADWFYVADSNGSLFPEQVGRIFAALASEVRTPVGFHAHDCLRLAFANSLAALSHGARLLDGSLGGLGKGGNLVTELIASYLKLLGAPHEIAPLARVANDELCRWIAPDPLRSCESAVAALLDLNLDEQRALRAGAQELRGGEPFLRELERRAAGRALASRSEVA